MQRNDFQLVLDWPSARQLQQRNRGYQRKATDRPVKVFGKKSVANMVKEGWLKKPCLDCLLLFFWFLKPRPTQVLFALSKCPHNGSGKPCMEASRNKSPGSGLDRIRMQIFNKLPAIRAAAVMETTGKKKKSLVGSERTWVQDSKIKAEDRERNGRPWNGVCLERVFCSRQTWPLGSNKLLSERGQKSKLRIWPGENHVGLQRATAQVISPLHSRRPGGKRGSTAQNVQPSIGALHLEPWWKLLPQW